MANEKNRDEPEAPTDNDEEEPPPATCWERGRAEMNPCQDWFLKQQPANDRPSDIAMSFGPEGWKPLFYKLICTVFVVGTAIYTFIYDKNDRGWWFAYMTNWVQTVASIYMLLSCFNTLFGAPQPYKRVSSKIIKSTWLLYSYSAHFAWLVALFWWLFVFKWGVTVFDWANVVPHSIVPFTVTMDGLNVNRIPLRWQHYWGFVLPCELLYVFWTWIQSDVAQIDNPNLNATLVDDDAIYPVYDWKDNATEAAIISAVGIFAIGPVVWFLMWMFSQYWLICCCVGDRRLYYIDPRKGRKRKERNTYGAGWYAGDDDDDDDGDIQADADSLGGVEENPDEPKVFRSKLEELAYKKSKKSSATGAKQQ